jgi:hypothetical protein
MLFHIPFPSNCILEKGCCILESIHYTGVRSGFSAEIINKLI